MATFANTLETGKQTKFLRIFVVCDVCAFCIKNKSISFVYKGNDAQCTIVRSNLASLRINLSTGNVLFVFALFWNGDCFEINRQNKIKKAVKTKDNCDARLLHGEHISSLRVQIYSE